MCVLDGGFPQHVPSRLRHTQRVSVSFLREAEWFAAVWMDPTAYPFTHLAAPTCRLPGMQPDSQAFFTCSVSPLPPRASLLITTRVPAWPWPRAGWDIFLQHLGAFRPVSPTDSWGPRVRGVDSIGQAGDPEPRWVWGSIGGSLPGHLPPEEWRKNPRGCSTCPGPQTGALGGTLLPGVAPRAEPKQTSCQVLGLKAVGGPGVTVGGAASMGSRGAGGVAGAPPGAAGKATFPGQVPTHLHGHPTPGGGAGEAAGDGP